jgi:putative ABC transport system permease protein
VSEPLPRLERLLATVLLRGPGCDFVIGDLAERYAEELSSGVPRATARARLRWQILASALSWWRPSAIAARRDESRNGRGRRPAVPQGERERGGVVEMGLWTQDLRIAARGLARRPGFALGVAMTLALGIGATTTIFSVVDGVLLRPLSYDAAGQLAAVGAVFPTREWDDEGAGLQHLAGISYLNYSDYSERTRSFDGLAAIELTSVLLPDRGDGPELVSSAVVSEDFFALLGVTPALGRVFLPEEYSTSAPSVVMLTYGAWERRYGGDPSVVGRPLERVGSPTTVVGVLSPDFDPPEAFFGQTPDYWMPFQPDHPRYLSRGRRSLFVLGRLAGGATVEAARREARAIGDDLAADFPEGNGYADGSHLGIGVNGLLEQTVGTAGRPLGVFLAAAGLLLLLAAMNAATLLLARALDRVKEVGVRMALGAGRARVLRLLLAEAGLLSLAGGVFGVVLAWVGVAAFLKYAPGSIPRTSQIALDGRVLGVAALVSLGAGLAAGLLPALRLTRRPPWERLRHGPRAGASASRLRGLLVGGQVAVAVLLVSGAGLLFTSFVRILSVDPGFDPAGLISMNVGLKRPGAASEPAWQGWDLLLAEVAAVPGVTAVAGTTNPPFQDPFWAPRLLLPGDGPETRREGIAGYAITPGYFETVGTRLLEGRDFRRLDGPDAEFVAIVNETFMRTQLGGQNALGVIVEQAEGDERTPYRVVGVVEDVVQARAEDGPRAAIYMPYTQSEWPFVQAVVHTELPPAVVLPELRKAVGRFSAFVPPRDVRTMEDRMAATRTTPRFQAMLIGAFALLALLLAAAGLYGSLAHAVGRRERELGIRIALGAERSGVLWMVLRQGMAVSAAGLALGLLATFASARVLSGFLFGVEPHDPVTLTLVAVLVLGVSAAACLLPARRATGVDPIEVLRAE